MAEQWISVNDRLPEGMEILPCSRRVLIHGLMGTVTAQYDYEKEMWIDNCVHRSGVFYTPVYYDESMQVTHWRYLPEPPGEGVR